MLLAFCLGTVQARTHVQLAFACQQSMIRVQHRPRLTMHHVFGHLGIFGNECADHAAALGTFVLFSSHNVVTRWIRHNLDTSVCFDGCNNICDTLERLQHIRTKAATFHQEVLLTVFYVPVVHHMSSIALWLFVSLSGFCFP